MVVGTQGLSPDEALLGRPGHARKVQAISTWINKQYGNGQQIAWAKQGPTRVDLDIPDSIKRYWTPYQKVFERYGKVIYAAVTPTADSEGTAAVLTGLLDLMFEERGQKPMAQFSEHSGDPDGVVRAPDGIHDTQSGYRVARFAAHRNPPRPARNWQDAYGGPDSSRRVCLKWSLDPISPKYYLRELHRRPRAAGWRQFLGIPLRASAGILDSRRQPH
jgi:hypothetical protein